jgi:hypothetical protein
VLMGLLSLSMSRVDSPPDRAADATCRAGAAGTAGWYGIAVAFQTAFTEQPLLPKSWRGFLRAATSSVPASPGGSRAHS